MPADDLTRMQVAAPPAEAARLAEAAKKAGFVDSKGGRSAWILSVSSAAADDVLAGKESAEIPGKLAAELAAEAEAEGMTVAQVIRQGLALTRIARKAERAAADGGTILRAGGKAKGAEAST